MKTETQKKLKGVLSYLCYALLVLVFYAILRGVIVGLCIVVGVEATGVGAALVSGEFKWTKIAIPFCFIAIYDLIALIIKRSKKTVKKCENLGIFEG